MSFSLLASLPTLAPLLADAEIRFVDIGGRGEAMPQLRPFAPVAHYYSCEPDAAEAERLRHALPSDAGWRSVAVIGEAIASTNGWATLNLTKKAGMSSLLEPDRSVTDRYFASRAFDIMSTAKVPALTLADAARRYGFEDLCFIKLDTQGTELDILLSGDQLVKESVLGVYVEVSFHAFYKHQPLFADVDAYLRDSGLSLVGLYRTLSRRADHHADIYSRRTAVWAHCLYFREPEAILRGEPGERRRRDVLRLLMLTLAFKYFDLTFEVMATAARHQLFPDEQWQRVTAEVESSIREQSRRLLNKARRTHTDRGVVDPTDNLLGRMFRDNRYHD